MQDYGLHTDVTPCFWFSLIHFHRYRILNSQPNLIQINFIGKQTQREKQRRNWEDIIQRENTEQSALCESTQCKVERDGNENYTEESLKSLEHI